MLYLMGLAVLMVTGASALAQDDNGAAPAREVRIDFSKRQAPFQGWGTSLCWWAHGVGGWNDATVDEVVRLITDPDSGLGMNIFRYNIGGGDDPTHSHFRRWADVPGFKSSEDATYDWEADANQRRILLKLREARPDAVLEAFNNSPPFWMTHSGCAAGASDGGANLKEEYEEKFVDYLVEVASHYRDRYQINWHSVEPFNEPDVNWWRAGKNQEGCHVPRDQQGRIIRLLRARLDAAGMQSTLVSATDSNSIDDGLKSLQGFDAPTLSALGQFNVHSYSGKQRDALRELISTHAKPLWQSESGPLYVGGTPYEQIMKMAERITLDMNQLQPEAWLTWQVVAGGEWGCIQEDVRTQTVRVGKKFHMLSAFTRNIRPGDRFVEVRGDGSAVGAISESRKEAVIVLVNREKAPVLFRSIVSGLNAHAGRVEVVQMSHDSELGPIDPVESKDGAIELTVPPESVTRLLLRGVE